VTTGSARTRLLSDQAKASGKKLCDIPMASREPCTATPSLQLTRVDGSHFNACNRHYNRLVTLMRKRPEAYAPLVVGKI